MINGRITLRDIELLEKSIFGSKTKKELEREILNRIDYVKLKFFLQFPSFLRECITNLEPCIYPVDNKTSLEKIFSYCAVSYAANTGEQGKFINFLAKLPDSDHHELFDRFLEGLKSAFSITLDDYKLWMKYLSTASLECSLKLQTISFIKPDEKGYEIYNAIELDIKKNDDFIKNYNIAKDAIENYLFNSYAKVNSKDAEDKISLLDKYKDSPIYNFSKKYYSAVSELYSFDMKKKDSFVAEKILKSFQDAFESGKFLLGRMYKRFIETIISTEIYLTSKVTQRAEEYFDFAVKIGLYSYKDKSELLSPFAAKVNFWKVFLPFKFEKFQDCIDIYKNDMYDSELIEPYIRAKTKNGDYITNTENGTSKLIRLLQEYKCARYGFSDKFRQERAKLLFDLSEKLRDSFISTSCEEKEDSVLFNDQMMDKFDSRFRNSYENFVDKYMQLIPEASDTNQEELQKKAESLKKDIIETIKSSRSDELLKPCYQIDIFSSVPPIRLAIDSFDDEIVGCMLKKLKEDNVKLSGVVIEKNGMTLLQYAIRKYDLFVQDLENINKKKNRRPLTERVVPYAAASYKNPSTIDLFYKKQSVCDIVRTFPWEENGFIFHKTYAHEIVNIIRRISSYTDKIVSDDFYYLMVQSDPNDGQTYSDVIDLANYMLATGNAHLDEGNDIFSIADTVVTFSSRSENYSFLKFLLTDGKEHIKNIINEKVLSTETGSFSEETALHTFMKLQLDTIKIAIKDMAHSQLIYDDAIGKIRTFYPLFRQAGARIDIPDEAGKSVQDIIDSNKEELKELQDVL